MNADEENAEDIDIGGHRRFIGVLGVPVDPFRLPVRLKESES